jgi:hypothetical protein
MLKPMKRIYLAVCALAWAGCLFVAITSPAAMHFVNVNGTNPTPPFTNWITAATNIQDATSVAAPGDAVLVTNGVYSGVVSATNPVAVRSVNGPQFTIIDGGGTKRCAWLTNGASLNGFTLTNGYIHYIIGYNILNLGGGAWCATNAFLTNCVIAGNRALGGWVEMFWNPWRFIPGEGGGVFGGTLFNCLLTGNSADVGGGAANCTLYNCTLTGNDCPNNSMFAGVWHHHYGVGGGVAGGALYNCIAYFNDATDGANCDTSCVLNYCCTTPLPTNGVGNITNVPRFVDTNGWSNLHLRTNSPGINTGNNDYVTTTTDLDGNPRIAGGTVDMGAYEVQPGASGGQFGNAAYSPLTGFSFTFSGAIIGQPYRIQTSPSLAAGTWSDLTNFTFTEPITIADPYSTSTTSRFYRAVTP